MVLSTSPVMRRGATLRAVGAVLLTVSREPLRAKSYWAFRQAIARPEHILAFPRILRWLSADWRIRSSESPPASERDGRPDGAHRHTGPGQDVDLAGPLYLPALLHHGPTYGATRGAHFPALMQVAHAVIVSSQTFPENTSLVALIALPEEPTKNTFPVIGSAVEVESTSIARNAG
jgi:hypothetical protein